MGRIAPAKVFGAGEKRRGSVPAGSIGIVGFRLPPGEVWRRGAAQTACRRCDRPYNPPLDGNAGTELCLRHPKKHCGRDKENDLSAFQQVIQSMLTESYLLFPEGSLALSGKDHFLYREGANSLVVRLWIHLRVKTFNFCAHYASMERTKQATNCEPVSKWYNGIASLTSFASGILLLITGYSCVFFRRTHTPSRNFRSSIKSFVSLVVL